MLMWSLPVVLIALKHVIVWGQFEKRLEYTIQENQPSGIQVGHISSDMVHLLKSGDAKIIDSSFTYIMRDKSKYFQLDQSSSVLKTLKTIDLELLCPKYCNEKGTGFINLVINVWKTNQLRGVVQVKVVVIDQNDNSPVFPNRAFEKKIKEVLYGVGKIIELPKAIDRDITPEFNKVAYKLNEQSDTFMLQINNDSNPRLVLLKDIDYEIETKYLLTLIAWDSKLPAVKSYLEIKIEVIDINDCEPVFPNTIMDLLIDENAKVGKVIIKLKAIDKDKNSNLIYGMVSPTKPINKDTFTVKLSGEVVLLHVLDVDVQNEYDIPVYATDGEFTANAKLRVIIRDVNNHPPSYNLNPASLSIEENQPPQLLIGQVTVSDVDSVEVNGNIRCNEPPGKSNLQSLLFRPDPADNPTILKYDMYSRVPLDREEEAIKSIYLICQDGGLHERLTSTLTISLTVLDVNDNPPVFIATNYTAEIAENNGIGDKLIQVKANDKDYKENAVIGYTIMDGPNSNMFFIDPNTGWISVMRELDREETESYQLHILATNSPSKHLFSATTTLNVKVTDKNDNRPRLKPPTQFSLMENLKPGTMIGHINADDNDSGNNGRMTFDLLSSTFGHLFEVKKNGSIFAKMAFDREMNERYCLNIRVNDLGQPQSLSVTGTICIIILDANDNTPTISVSTVQTQLHVSSELSQNVTISENSNIIIASVYEAAGYKIASVTAQDVDKDENGQTTFMLEEINEEGNAMPSLFTIDENDGSIKISRVMSRDHIGDYKIRIIVHDKGKPILRSEKIIQVQIKDILPYSSINTPIVHVTGNVVIVIILSTISAFLTAILIGAILCMVRPCCQSNQSASPDCHDSQNINTQTLLQKLPPNYYSVNPYGQPELYDQAWMQSLNRQRHQSRNSTLNLRQNNAINKIDYLKYDSPGMYTSQNALCNFDHMIGKHNGCSCDQGACIRYPAQKHSHCLSQNPEEQCSDSGRGASDDDLKALNINGSLASSSRALEYVYGTYSIGDTANKSNWKKPILHSITNERERSFCDEGNEIDRGQSNFAIPNSFGQKTHIPMTTFSSPVTLENEIQCSNSRSEPFYSLSNIMKSSNNTVTCNIQNRANIEKYPNNHESEILDE